MRPRLRADVRYVKSPDGVYVRGSAGACTLTGGASYEWLDRLAPFLTGEHALTDLVAPLRDEQRDVVEHLVRSLVEQRLLVDAREDRPHSLSADEQREYAPEIAFLRYGADSAEHRFERLRSARVALAGGGPVLAAVLEAGLRSGWRRVAVWTDAAEVDGLRAVARGAVRDAAQDVVVDVGSPSDADLLLRVSDRPDDVVPLGARAVGQVLVVGDEAWVTAVGPPGRVAMSCLRRLGALRGGDDDLVTGPVPGIIAAHVVLSCFHHLTGTADEAAEPVLTRIDLRTLSARTHRPLPYTFSDVVPAVAPEDRADERLVDERVGVLRRLDEDDLPQVPLAVCRATVSDPESVLPPWAPLPVVVGWGFDRERSRSHAVLAALATYGSLMGRGGAGVDLLTGRPCALPAVAARAPYRAPVGVAAGRSWGDAVAAGLRAHCEALLADRPEPGRPCDPDTVVRSSGDERAAELVRLLRAGGKPVVVSDLGDVLGVPAFRLRVAGDCVVTCAATTAEALRDGLERVLLHRQCEVEPVITRWVAEGDGVPAADDPRCRALAAALRRAGHSPAAVPLVVDDAVRERVPCLVRVVVDGD
ncbi:MULTISPECIES: hypothetical protein [Saccharothrix]|uniref:hypothetical protein n=1 Tax=Saccharothrix TaxID=2071 RepID=UPI000ACFE36D|nr:hypothetical protein [Saccharothrix sp. CB00851]